MSSFYPPIDPFSTGFLEADDIHTVYYEQSGNPEGMPVLFLHGGPGAGSSPRHRQFFDPIHYRIIILDQRGCGRSKPLGELRQNSTDLLIADIEKIRALLDIKRWHVFGGSWGSTLSLAYAISHPDRVMSLALRGIFLMTQPEINWFLYGVKSIFPDAWAEFVKPLSEDERKDILASYYCKLTHEDPNIRLVAAQSWAAYESAICKLIPQPDLVEESKAPHYALPIARIEAHYFMNDKLRNGSYLFDNLHTIRHIPAAIVQGRYDVICPMEVAYRLHQAWPESEFIIVPDSGHSAFEEGIASALVKVMDNFKSIR